ncbi:hypothetical protein [Streptomyces sp. V4I2]|uniref:hypothetical protein n=1 Tax=Streptomyces sp. V4I2 TaxID=3042280 RepID=UPI00278059AB|nr:hypothetical protein [Streptomyces sp. V4I2]MDQ1048101.1 hypothetical protein [Streptomyces sp. V4I2]
MTGDSDNWTPDGPIRRDGPAGPDDGNGHGMGERQNGSGVPDRRRVRPDDRLPGGPAVDPAALETLLAAAMRAGTVDADAEQRAVAAFRDARDAGAHRARTRRRDDWRPREQRSAARSLRTTLSVFLASLALGGVAYAAIGSSGDSPSDGAGDDRGRATASASDEARPGGPTTAPGSGPTDRPGTAQDTEAHCRAYEQVQGRGKALDSTAWQWLVAAAGGEAKVPAYCAEQLARATAENKPVNPGNPGKTVKPSKSAKGGAGSGSAGGNAGSGQADGNADTNADTNADNNQEKADKAEGKN